MGFDHTRLDLFRRQQSPVQEHVIDEFVAGNLSRRDFIHHATMVGISMSAIGVILDASGSSKAAVARMAASGKAGATIRAGMTAPGGPVNPLTASDEGASYALGICGEWLCMVDEHYNTLPWLAESWAPNHDASAWTFKIRQGVKFNDGTPMTVDDVVYTFKQQANPKIAPSAAGFFGGHLTPEGVEKLDHRHVRLNLDGPVFNWPAVAVSQANYNLIIVPNHFDWTKFNTEMPGTGRFKMVKFSDTIGGTFVRNPHYWGKPAKPAQLELTYYSGEAAITAAMEANDLDVNLPFSVTTSPQLLDGRFNVLAIKGSGNDQISMRCDKGPFTNKLVRQAVALTLNRPEIIKALFKGYAVVANESPFAPEFPYTDHHIPQRTQNISEAKKLMAKAGMSRGFSCRLAVPETLQDPELAQIVKASAARIGIDISILTMTEAQYYGSLKFGSSPYLDETMTVAYWLNRSSPNTILGSVFATTNAKTGAGAYNNAHFKSPRFDSLLKQFLSAVELPRQRKISGEIQKLLLDETPEIFPYFYDTLVAMQKNVKGALPYPASLFYWNMTKS